MEYTYSDNFEDHWQLYMFNIANCRFLRRITTMTTPKWKFRKINFVHNLKQTINLTMAKEFLRSYLYLLQINMAIYKLNTEKLGHIYIKILL